MTDGIGSLGLSDVFATFETSHATTHALALLAGVAVCLAAAVGAGTAAGPLLTVAVASVATGAYYGALYTRALGGPVWDLVTPGLVTAVALRVPPARPAGGLTGTAEWVSAVCTFGTVGAIVWAWHRHLGTDGREWALTHYPAAFQRHLGGENA